MIERLTDEYVLMCDICGQEADERFDDFYDAVDYKKGDGWKSQKNSKGEWEDVCPGCV